MTTIKANSPEQELEWARAERIRCDNDLAEATQALEAAQERERKAQEAVEKTYGQGNHAAENSCTTGAISGARSAPGKSGT